MALRAELIGSKVRLPNKNIAGRIIDETKNTFVIKMVDNKKRILKKNNFFEFDLNGKKEIIEGNKLIMRPEERIKFGGYNEK